MINFVPHLELDYEVPRHKMLHHKADNATPLHQNCQTMLKTDKFTRTSTMGKKNETQLNSSGGSVVNVSSRQEFYRPRQVAELLGISLRTYYTMVRRGKLHPVKLSERVTVVARKEILSMIEMALGETLSQSIFSKDKRNDCKGKNSKGPSVVAKQICDRDSREYSLPKYLHTICRQAMPHCIVSYCCIMGKRLINIICLSLFGLHYFLCICYL